MSTIIFEFIKINKKGICKLKKNLSILSTKLSKNSKVSQFATLVKNL